MQAPESSMPPIIETALEYYEEAIDGIFDGRRFENFNMQKAKNAIQWCYEKCGYKVPDIIVVENPLEMMLLSEYLELDILITNRHDMFSSKMHMQICSAIDGNIEYGQFERYDPYSLLHFELRDKLYRKLNASFYKTIFEARWRDKAVETFGRGNFRKISLEILKFLDAQPGRHLLAKRKCDFRFEREAETRVPFLELFSAFSIHYLVFFKFLVEELGFPVKGRTDISPFYTLQRESGIFSCCCSEQFAIVCKYPKKIFQKKNDSWDLHNPYGRAIEWNHSFAEFYCHYVNGTYVDIETFESVNNRELSFDRFIQIESEEKKAAVIALIGENFGDDELLSFLHAHLVDEKMVQHANDYVETIRLYQTKECYSFLNNRFGESNQPFAWIEFTCPSTQKKHLISTCPGFKNATDAAKWHRPDFIPEEVPYIWTHAS